MNHHSSWTMASPTNISPMPTVKMESPQSSSYAFPRWCHCIIDLSTPATLERDFYAWLNGDENILHQAIPCCVFASSSNNLNIQSQKNCVVVKSENEENYPNCVMVKSEVVDENYPCSISSASTNSNNSTVVTSPTIKKKPRSRRKVANPADKGRGTNLYGRPYCPGRPLCMEERYQIISLFQAGMKVNAISKQLLISHGCVSKIITRWRDTGLLVPSSHSAYRRKRRAKNETTIAAN